MGIHAVAADPLPRQRLLPGSEGHSLEAIHDQRVETSLGTADLFFGFMDMARLLGHRTAELHLTLGEASRDPAFAPETCPSSYVQSRVEAMSVSATRTLTLLRNRLSALSESDREQGRQVLGHEPAILIDWDP